MVSKKLLLAFVNEMPDDAYFYAYEGEVSGIVACRRNSPQDLGFLGTNLNQRWDSYGEELKKEDK